VAFRVKRKRCFKCKRSKVITLFYRHKMMADGHLNKCKECTKLDVRLHRALNLRKIRAYDRARARTEKRKAHTRRVVERNAKEKPMATRCRQVTQRAVRSGLLKRRNCEICRSKRTIAHHDDYLEPLKVRWLCQAHHKQWHQKHGPGLNVCAPVPPKGKRYRWLQNTTYVS